MLRKNDLITATQICKALGDVGYKLKPRDINEVLENLGWMERHRSGMIPTTKGLEVGSKTYFAKNKDSYLKWSKEILDNAAFLAAVVAYIGDDHKTETATKKDVQSFTQKYRDGQKIRTADGHLVRSRAEKIIDNWFYHHRVVHACETPLFLEGREKPIVPDWTLEFGKVHVEFVGMLDKPDYQKHWDWKQELYAKHDVPMIMLLPDDIEAGLDYRLPPKLQEFGVSFI